MRIVLDAGHGGPDPGAIANGLYEAKITLTLANQVAAYLGIYDVEILHAPRTEPSERADFANVHGADYFLSLHVNACGGEGFESYIFNGRYNEKTKRIRDVLHDQVMQYLRPLGVPDRSCWSAFLSTTRGTRRG